MTINRLFKASMNPLFHMKIMGSATSLKTDQHIAGVWPFPSIISFITPCQNPGGFK
jgi:hypothetical protein